MPTEYTLSS